MSHQRRYGADRSVEPVRIARHPGSAGPERLPALAGNAAFARLVQRSTAHDHRTQGAGPLDPRIGAEISAARGGGAPLPAAVGADMSTSFGVDFSAVRVHTDARADQLNRSVQAAAFTVGTDLFFSQGSYDPGSAGGRELLAHELTHVVQQGTGAVDGQARVSHPDDPAEVQARRIGRSVAGGGPAPAGADRSQVSGLAAVDRLQAGGNAALARMLDRGVHRCGSTPPELCGCHDDEQEDALVARVAATLVQRSGGGDHCGGAQPCAAGDACAAPDPGSSGMCVDSPLLEVLVDTEESSWDSALRNQNFGHAFVRFTDTDGNRYTYGFYPASELPNENRRQVPGCVRHPDTSHLACVDATETYRLTQEQYTAALTAAQNMCRSPNAYGQSYTCATFVEDVARAAGQHLPSATSDPTTVFYQHVPAIDNPNTLKDNIEAEHHVGSDSDVRDWVAKQGAAGIAAAPMEDIIKRSQRLLEGWISDDDVAALETICAAITADQRRELATALADHVAGMNTEAQRRRVQAALAR